MTNIENKIDRAIKEKQLKYGMMGEENININMTITKEEREDFYKLEKYNQANYSWEIENNILYISYTEQVND